MKHTHSCPNCGEPLVLDQDSIGLHVRCPECEHEFPATAATERAASPERSPAPILPDPVATNSKPIEAPPIVHPPISQSLPDDQPTPTGEILATQGVSRPSLGALWRYLQSVVAGVGILLRHLGRYLHPIVLCILGLLGVVASFFLPFSAKASELLPAPGLWDLWAVPRADTRWLVALLLLCIPLAFLVFARGRIRPLGHVAVLGMVGVFCSTWMLAASRAEELADVALPPGSAWRGAGWGAALLLAGATIALAACFRNWNAALSRPYLKLFGTTLLSSAILLSLGTLLAQLHSSVWPTPFQIRAATALVRDIYGREVPDSLAIRVEAVNARDEPAELMIRKGASDAADANQLGAYRLRLQIRSAKEPRWQQVPRPAWSGPWPRLDFRLSRALAPDEAWRLEAPVFRPDLDLDVDAVPDEVMIEVVDEFNRCVGRRIVARPSNG